jgi:hypothetical protein
MNSPFHFEKEIFKMERKSKSYLRPVIAGLVGNNPDFSTL